jgi:hypothetical protein
MEGKRKNEKGKRLGILMLPLLFSFFVFLFSFIGCGPRTSQVGQPKGYFGPTQPMADVVDEINRNNGRLPTLWAEVAKMRAQFVDDDGKRHDETLDGGNLLYRSPGNVKLLGDKLALGNVVEMGANDKVYWFSIKQGPDTAWWGRFEHLGQPCAKAVPIRPDLITEVLAVRAIETDLTVVPAPVMRFNNDADAYMFVWQARLPDRWFAVKEVWYDRATKRPKLVNLFDADGRVVLRAYLTGHEPVEVTGLPKEQWPTVATEYDLLFPETGSKLSLRLGKVQLTRQVRRVTVPNEKTFAFEPEPKRLGVSKVIQLDEACGR